MSVQSILEQLLKKKPTPIWVSLEPEPQQGVFLGYSLGASVAAAWVKVHSNTGVLLRWVLWRLKLIKRDNLIYG
jgi:hypothetical protein